MYTYRWLSLLVWLYFTEGVVRATTDTGCRGAGRLEVALCLLLFAASALYMCAAAQRMPRPPACCPTAAQAARMTALLMRCRPPWVRPMC
jgi:hypothetical protein